MLKSFRARPGLLNTGEMEMENLEQLEEGPSNQSSGRGLKISEAWRGDVIHTPLVVELGM